MTSYDPSIYDGFVRLSRLIRAGRLCNFVWGLLSQTHANEDVRPDTQGPEPSGLQLVTWAFSTGVVDSLVEGFVGAWYKKRRRVGLRNRLYRFVQNV